ncbi:MAG: hypothetical protein ACJ700_07105, partial [Nitrososphaera sp.]
EPVNRRGNSVSYRITGDEPLSVVTMDTFVFPDGNGITEWFNDPESTPDLNDPPEHNDATDRDFDDSADGS